MEGITLSAFRNRMLRIFGPKKKEVARGYRKLPLDVIRMVKLMMMIRNGWSKKQATEEWEMHTKL
jgi:hypothetical protein